MTETGGAGRSGAAWLLVVAAVVLFSVEPAAARVIRAGSPAERKVALTFDACATRAPSRVDRKVIQVLVTTHTRATLFLGGKWMLDHPAETKDLASRPQFELGNHSTLHPHMLQQTGAQMAEELRRTQEIMRSLTGRTARFFRPPYEEWSPALAETAAALGMTTVLHTLASGDPDTNATAAKLIDYVVRNVRNGTIVVMHVNGRGWHTAEALPDIISRLRAKGFELVTVGDLVERLPVDRPADTGPEKTIPPGDHRHPGSH